MQILLPKCLSVGLLRVPNQSRSVDCRPSGRYAARSRKTGIGGCQLLLVNPMYCFLTEHSGPIIPNRGDAIPTPQAGLVPNLPLLPIPELVRSRGLTTLIPAYASKLPHLPASSICNLDGQSLEQNYY